MGLKLDSAMLSRFVSGQMEVQNRNEGYLYRGEISRVEVTGGDLLVNLKWMAKGEGYPPLPQRWVNDDSLEYSVSLEICSASDIGDGRLCLNSFITGEIVVFFPPGGSKLDPSEVIGLL